MGKKPPWESDRRAGRVTGRLLAVTAFVLLLAAPPARAQQAGPSQSFALTIKGTVQTAIVLEVRALGQSGTSIDLGSLATAAPFDERMHPERFAGGARFSFPMEIEVRQSGVACSTILARLDDSSPPSGIVAVAPESGSPVELGFAPSRIASVRGTHAIVRATGELTLADTLSPGPLAFRMLFEAVAGCGG